jgi:type IV secretory pathway VirB2 component (pilin)
MNDGVLSLESKSLKTLKQFLTVAVVIGAFLPLSVHAAALPWESFTQTLACELKGPWVKWMAVIAIALGGIMFGLGELSGPFQKMMQIAGGFSVAVGATAVAAKLLGPEGATDFSGCEASLKADPVVAFIQYTGSVLKLIS